ncbi:hypothetical protein LCGC14_1728820 [marine sediment metagenome]|uniref:Uncharacterized protein n=1 Tax=marine sediment metagenome TaxID=412755 RepID=A0A0F9HA04_9ZZZZ
MSDDIFEKLNKQIKESGKRWKEIEKISNKLKKMVDGELYSGEASLSTDMNMICMIAILTLLLVDQLRPMNSTEDQVIELQDNIKTLLGSFTGGKIK